MSDHPAARPRGGVLRWALWGAALLGVAVVVYIMAQASFKPAPDRAPAKPSAAEVHTVTSKLEHPSDGAVPP
ncbi:MAG: TlpA family protein disulfide reductase, partial [Phenylobacterium sp.]